MSSRALRRYIKSNKNRKEDAVKINVQTPQKGMPLSSIQCQTCLAIRSVAADGETPSPIPTYSYIENMKDE